MNALVFHYFCRELESSGFSKEAIDPRLAIWLHKKGFKRTAKAVSKIDPQDVVAAGQAASEGAFAGPAFAKASATGSLIKSLARKHKVEAPVRLLGADEIATSHGDAFTPLGKLYEYGGELISNLLG